MIKYFLFIVFAGNMQVIGPFDGLLACEKAASQVRIASVEADILGVIGTTCMSQKHADFKYKEQR